MSKRKLFGISGVLLTLVLILSVAASVYAGSLATFENPRITACSLEGLTVSGTLRIGATVYVEEYLNGDLRNTFTGSAGVYSGYVTRHNASAFPYDWKTVLSFKDSGGALIEQYVLEGDCSALNEGTVEFREVELEPTGMRIG